jgi:hypothetical protein
MSPGSTAAACQAFDEILEAVTVHYDDVFVDTTDVGCR